MLSLEEFANQVRNVKLEKLISIELDADRVDFLLFRTAKKEDGFKVTEFLTSQPEKFFEYLPDSILSQFQSFYDDFDLSKEYHINVFRCEKFGGKFVENEIIATMSLAWTKLQPQSHVAHIGIMLDMKSQKKGVALRVSETLKEFIAEFKHLRRVTALVVEGNDPSLGLCRKMGFEQEGLMKSAWMIKNRLYNLHIMGILL